MTEPYQLIRSDRRTLSVSINGEGAVVVRAPRRMPKGEIEAFLHEKRRWIEEKQALVRSQAVGRFVPEDGACLPWLGGALTVRRCRVPEAVEEAGVLLVPDESDALMYIRKWRRARAQDVLIPRVQLWAQRTGLAPQSLAFGEARTRWGSMSRAGAMRLNLALMHCPMELIDYVIVHELTHLVEMNHSPAFHARVRATLPDADARRARLKTLGGVTGLLREEKTRDGETEKERRPSST